MMFKPLVQSALCLLAFMAIDDFVIHCPASAPETAKSAQPSIKVIPVQSLSTYKAISITAGEGENKASYTGVPLRAILAKEYPIDSMPEWKKLARQELVVEVTGQDGYPALITALDIAMNKSGDKYVLASERDKKPLPDGIQLICPMDEAHVRWVKNVAGIRIVSVPR